MLDIISETQSMERRGDKQIIEVAVRGPVGLDEVMQLRARARALLSSGVLSTTVDAVGSVATGDIQRLTDIRSIRPATRDVQFSGDGVVSLGTLLETKIVTVEVLRE